MSEKKVDDLKHELLEEKIETINSKVHSGFGNISDKLEFIVNTLTSKFEELRTETKAQNQISFIQREEIIKKQDVTNGRVKTLEAVTSSLKYLQDNKKMAGLIFYAIYNMLQHLSISNLFKIYQWIQSVM